MLTETAREAMRRNGHEQGVRNIETGHIQAVGRAQGKRNVDTGHLERIKTPEVLEAGGRAAGKIAVESGQIHTIKTPESCSNGGIRGNHMRWHVGRNRANVRCVWCQAEKLWNRI
jgi:hypothetical protein